MSKATFIISGSLHVLEVGIDPVKISAGGIQSYPQLIFPLAFQSIPQRQLSEILFDTFHARLDVDRLGIIGDSIPLPMNQRTGSNKLDWYSTLRIPLDWYRIEQIEQARNGGNMNMSLDLEVGYTRWLSNTMKEDRDSHTTSTNLQLTISQSDWINNVLPRLGYGIIKLVEMPAVSRESCKELKLSYEALEKAEKHFKNGDYDDAAGKCRVALEPFFAWEGDGKDRKRILGKDWQAKVGDATYKWLNDALLPISNATNKTHHPSSEPCYNRLDAQMILVAAISFINYAARKINL